MSVPFKFKSKICLAVLSLLFGSTLCAHAESPAGVTTSIGITGHEEQCLTCHEGIEEVSRSHPLKLGCTSCHGGNGASEYKNEAHATLIYDPAAGTGKRNPSSLKVVHLSCGRAQCHSGHQDETRNHVDRVRKSMMGTLSGVITGLRTSGVASRENRHATGSIK